MSEWECQFCGQGCNAPFQVDDEYDEDNDGPLDRLIHEAELAAMCDEEEEEEDGFCRYCDSYYCYC